MSSENYMIFKKKLLFLGYDKRKTKLIEFLENKEIDVRHTKDHLTVSDIELFDIVVSFGYTKLLNTKFLKKLKRSPINLHMSFLPYNRGSHPNFWSFIDDTPKGITIHEIDEGADTGSIVFQKNFNLDPNLEKYSTFKKTYDFLFLELEKLFIENFENILHKKYIAKKQNDKYTIHTDEDLPKEIINWDINILEYLKKHKKR